ncbi:glycosyltransferase [Sphingomonas lenta]|uniref:Glycosyl transferase n=1 Tax=Sphingomonas lenta TaxID=1141887 RepID=A0A2A2SAQ1_9SPHN|nr:glycosyltransferase [Sphingomonas lenta]PAX06329.1 glycosyl transferase [Sphingomonas lenta]
MINSIGSGGAERALGRILDAAGDRRGRYELHLALLDREPEMRALPMLDGRHRLDARGGLLRSVVQLRQLLRRLRPVLVVSLLVRANMATALAAPAAGARAVLCERMHLSSHLAGRYRGAKLRALRLLARRLYRRADLMLAVSEGVRRDLVERFGMPAGRVLTIENPYDVDRIVAGGARAPSIALPPAFIVAVGRLVAAKGFALLIDAYARADPPLPLVVLGEGPDRARFEAQAAAAGLGERIRFAGFVADPFAVMARAEFLVSASHNEGFPNAIAEAMALGVPVVATDCPSGPAELLGSEAGAPGEVAEAPFGLVVRDGDRDGLADAIGRMADPGLRARLAAAGRRRIEDFRAERIAERYWAAFDRFAS